MFRRGIVRWKTGFIQTSPIFYSTKEPSGNSAKKCRAPFFFSVSLIWKAGVCFVQFVYDMVVSRFNAKLPRGTSVGLSFWILECSR